MVVELLMVVLWREYVRGGRCRRDSRRMWMRAVQPASTAERCRAKRLLLLLLLVVMGMMMMIPICRLLVLVLSREIVPKVETARTRTNS